MWLDSIGFLFPAVSTSWDLEDFQLSLCGGWDLEVVGVGQEALLLGDRVLEES